MTIVACERGTASVEVAAMLPVFLVLLAGSAFLYRLGLAKQEALALARACAFQYAVLGCPDDATQLSVCEGLTVGEADKLAEQGARQDSPTAGSVLDEVAGWWLVGDLISSLFGTGARATATRNLRTFMGDGDTQVSGSFYLVCNTVSRSWGERINEVMCGVADKLRVKGSLEWLEVCK